ncbi:MAG: PEGA domain-containing protein [Acidobacteriia bacterium]|nr:PEGA domain-containing protein [Terriglobia bacterium]
MKTLRRIHPSLWAMFLIPTLLLALTAYAGNDVMGEIQFEGKSHVEKTSGVWVDGQYVGYLKELNGSKKVLLLPGDHNIVVRQDGYKDFTEKVLVQPGGKQVVLVRMEKAPTAPFPDMTATVKIDVNPSRAAVFMDGLFVGHVGEFKGLGRGMLIAPGTHQFRIALPGYQTFETDIDPLANQEVQIKTDLVKNGAPLAGPLLTAQASENTSASAAHGVPQEVQDHPKR